MAAGGKSGRSAAKAKIQPERADFVGYVNITLTEDDKADFDAWELENDVVSEEYLSALELGYQFTVKCDLEHQSFICSVSNWQMGRADAGVIYTARAANPNRALVKAIYVTCRKFAFNLANGYVNQARHDAF